jgi:predicted 2-oxoglutarate/Fe(II)-dependent dioxygenase YbiX/peroxiredoxin
MTMPFQNPSRFLTLGEHVPFLHVKTPHNPRFAFGSLGGRYVMMVFLSHNGTDNHTQAYDAIKKAQKGFSSQKRVLVAVSPDEALISPERHDLNKDICLLIHDQDEEFFNAVGLKTQADPDRPDQNQPGNAWMLLDPTLRVVATWPLSQSDEAAEIFLKLGEPDAHVGVEQTAPVLVVPRVFEPGFCQALMRYYEQHGGKASGVTREKDGKTMVELDDGVKKRFDCLIEDEKMRQDAMQRIYWRLVPQIQKAFQFQVTRMERYIVCCYDSGSGGYFKAHRDNTTKGTAHRRFAVSINLNAGEFEGGDLRFPEFGARTYRAPTGGAVVFSCSLLHEATPITQGRRFAFLPFLYDDAAAEIRRQNNQFVDDKTVGQYKG